MGTFLFNMAHIIIVALLSISKVTSAVYLNDQWYEKESDSYCQYTTSTYPTLLEAENACSNSTSCTMVYDDCCDGGYYETCTGAQLPSYGGSCVWIKRVSDDCDPNPCVHGTCIDGIDDYTCNCEPGWEGKNCNININDCDPNPCVHGTCQDEIDDYTCYCETGWEGKNCDIAQWTTHQVTTISPTTETSTQAPYNCMDITVDYCRDATLDIIETVSMDSLEECYDLCATVFQNVCNGYIYNMDTKICRVIEDHLYYFDGCDRFGAGYDSVGNCLVDDIKYPDMCKKMVESECAYYGNVLLKQGNVLKIDECVQLNDLMHGQFYRYDNDEKECSVYESNSRDCRVHRGVNGVSPSSCPK